MIMQYRFFQNLISKIISNLNSFTQGTYTGDERAKCMVRYSFSCSKQTTIIEIYNTKIPLVVHARWPIIKWKKTPDWSKPSIC